MSDSAGEDSRDEWRVSVMGCGGDLTLESGAYE